MSLLCSCLLFRLSVAPYQNITPHSSKLEVLNNSILYYHKILSGVQAGPGWLASTGSAGVWSEGSQPVSLTCLPSCWCMAGRLGSAGFLWISKESLYEISPAGEIGLVLWHIQAPGDKVILKVRLRNDKVSLLTSSKDQSSHRPALIQGKRRQTLPVDERCLKEFTAFKLFSNIVKDCTVLWPGLWHWT